LGGEAQNELRKASSKLRLNYQNIFITKVKVLGLVASPREDSRVKKGLQVFENDT
jgi:hypothetical protein